MMGQISAFIRSGEDGIERPVAVTIICILGFIGTVLSIPMVFSDIAMQIGSWFPPYSGTVALLSLISMIGLWFTRKWSAYVYTLVIGANQVVLLGMGQWHFFVLIVQVVIVAVLLWHLDSNTKSLFSRFVRYLKKQIWAIIVVYMVGIHNFYREEDKSPDEMVYKIENNQKQEDDEPN